MMPINANQGACKVVLSPNLSDFRKRPGFPYPCILHFLIESGVLCAAALVDGLQYERYFGEELQPEKDAVMPFFDRWPDSRIAFAGPWFVDLSKAMHLHERLRELEYNLPSVSWIASRLSPAQLMEHFKPFIDITLYNGKSGLLRFWDPRVANQLPVILEEDQLRELMQGVEEWLYSMEGNVQSLKWSMAT